MPRAMRLCALADIGASVFLKECLLTKLVDELPTLPLVSYKDEFEFGIAQARRGWVSAREVINTLPVDKMFGLLK